MNEVAINPESEGATLRSLVAGLTLHLKLFRRLALQTAYPSEQPRVSAGQPNGGQWVGEAEISHNWPNHVQVAETCQEYIAAN